MNKRQRNKNRQAASSLRQRIQRRLEREAFLKRQLPSKARA